MRLSESLAKMRLSAEVSSQDVQEALRLFKVSTMAAASAGSTAGDVGSLRPETQQEVRRAEDFLKRRIAVRSTVNRKKVYTLPYFLVSLCTSFAIRVATA